MAGTRSVEAQAVGHTPGREGPNTAAAAATAVTVAPADLASAAVPATPAAFDALYTAVAPRLTWQTFLLTANRHRTTHCVRRAFQLAWTNWPTVSADPSPEGWIRAAAFDLALSPWHGGGPRMQHAFHLPHRRAKAAAGVTTDLPISAQDRALLQALLRLPRPQRRALVLHDVVGLDWAQTAAEVEGTTPVTFGRVARARRALAKALPGVVGADPEVAGFGRQLGDRLRATALRAGSETPKPAAAGATRARARLHDGGLSLAAGALTLATAGFLGAGAVWGTPMHPAERRIVPHPTRATVIGTADDEPTRDIQPPKVPAPPLTPFATGPGLIQQNQDTSGDARTSSGSKGAKGAKNSGRPGATHPQHGRPHRPPAKKHH